MTVDQLKLLKYDNIPSKKYQTNSDIGVPSIRMFDEEVEKYCYMWREGGQFSTKKYNSKLNLILNRIFKIKLYNFFLWQLILFIF